jgi:hypothetical protein
MEADGTVDFPLLAAIVTRPFFLSSRSNAPAVLTPVSASLARSRDSLGPEYR